MAIHRNWIILALAAVVGVGAALVAMRYLDERIADIERRAQGRTARAVVAKENLPAGTRLGPENVAVREIPAEWLHSGAITPEQFERAAATPLAFPAARGEPILWPQLEGKRAATFSARLSPGRRAVTVPVDEISSISGMLEPGDRIDLLVTVRRDTRNLTFALLQNVNVLATGMRVDESAARDERGRSYTTITLDASPEDARRIIAARTVGKLTAMLRAPGDTGPISTERADALALLGLGDPVTGSTVPVIYGGMGNRLLDIPPLFPSPFPSPFPSAARAPGTDPAPTDATPAAEAAPDPR